MTTPKITIEASCQQHKQGIGSVIVFVKASCRPFEAKNSRNSGDNLLKVIGGEATRPETKAICLGSWSQLRMQEMGCGGGGGGRWRRNGKLMGFSLQQVTWSMSSIIDDLIFYRQRKAIIDGASHWRKDEEETFRNFSKKLNLSQGALLLQWNAEGLEMTNKVKMQDRDYCLRMRLSKKNRCLRVEARALMGIAFGKIGSRQGEILFLKEMAKWQFWEGREAVFYLKRGSLVMNQEVHLCLSDHLLRSKLTDFCNQVLSRNMTQFSRFVSKHWDRTGRFSIADNENANQLDQNILLSQLLSTTTTTFEASEESSQFREAEAAMQRKREDIKNLKAEIVNSADLELEVGRLYEWGPVGSEWARGNLEYFYSSCEKRLGGLLAMSKFVGEKRIDDYIFNTARINLKEVMAKPFSEGGSCHIFISKANISYISSVDSTSYFANEDKKDRILAMKKLKPEFQKKFGHKLEHEKNVVSKLKGGCSYFIPKYYRMEAALDPADTLFMEYIQGEELDFFVMARNQTISLWTKICLLLNLVHGLRYLNNYGIVHLDVKPINILVCRQLVTKIIDYGEAYHKDICPPNYSPGYTFPYVAPEVFARFQQEQQDRPPFDFSQKQDVFALGLILAELVFDSKVYQFSHNKFREVYSRAETLERYFFNSQRLTSFGDQRVITSLAHIVIRCLDPDPSKRPKLDWIAVTFKLILNSCTG